MKLDLRSWKLEVGVKKLEVKVFPYDEVRSWKLETTSDEVKSWQ